MTTNEATAILNWLLAKHPQHYRGYLHKGKVETTATGFIIKIGAFTRLPVTYKELKPYNNQ